MLPVFTMILLFFDTFKFKIHNFRNLYFWQYFN